MGCHDFIFSHHTLTIFAKTFTVDTSLVYIARLGIRLGYAKLTFAGSLRMLAEYDKTWRSGDCNPQRLLPYCICRL